MISKFKNAFKKTDIDEKNAFRKQVIGLLKSKFPDFNFVAGEDFEQIKVEGEKDLGLTLGLSNLKSRFLLTSQTSNDLKMLVEEQFASLTSTIDYVKNLSESETWEAVKNKVLLQIMPIEYSDKMPVLSFPIGDEIIIGIAIDDEKTYRYATKDDLVKWQVSEDEVYQTAQTNLSEKTKGIEMMIMPMPTGLVVINTLDSFDAARILLPDLRKFFAEHIGSPFYFGVPNRDFLICFSAESDEETQQNIRNQIKSDFGDRPYPLSKNTFIVDGKNEIKQIDSPSVHSNDNKPNLN
jgi:uncharacterized protein YtpQ (UPF0354 family)